MVRLAFFSRGRGFGHATPDLEVLEHLSDCADLSISLYPLWVVSAFSGCRPGEPPGPSWSDVDWITSQITIRRNLVKVPKEPPILAEPKTEKGTSDRIDFMLAPS